MYLALLFISNYCNVFNSFQIPKNDACSSSEGNRNGTCYTKEECSERNGLQMGTCAEGYGVCCVSK